MSNCTVRRATCQDAEAIVALWHELMLLHQRLAPLVWTLSDDAMARYREYLSDNLQDERKRVLVAARNGKVVGYLVAEKGTRPPALAHSGYGVLGEICVAPSARRTGVGKALVSACLQWFRSEGLTAAQASYASDNPMSVSFWEGLGFRRYQITGIRTLGDEADRRGIGDACGSATP